MTTTTRVLERGDIIRDETLLPNMRGRITDTTDLQQAIRQDNLLTLFPLQVIPHPTEPAMFLLWDGFRRLTAVDALGITSIPATISEGTPEEALEWQIATNLRREFPAVSLNSDGEVVGGLCWAVHKLATERGLNNRQIKNKMGLPVDTVSAFRHLYDEDTAVLQRVVAGELDITVYARLKKQPAHIKAQVLARPGKLTREKVDRFLQGEKVEGEQEKDAPERIGMNGTAVTARLTTIANELEWLLGQADDMAVEVVTRIAFLAQQRLGRS